MAQDNSPLDLTASDVWSRSSCNIRASGAMNDLVGRQIGNFVVKALLGAGAMGEVYVGEHTILGHKVAIKVMQASLSARQAEEGVARFITEARVLTQIKDSPHVIKLFDFGQLDGGMLYYVMEYLEGHDLEHELRDKLPLSPAEALVYLDAIGAGLAAAHAQQVVHRDLKPANVFVVTTDDTKVLKLIDFGLAKNLGSMQKLTVGGMGTPIYSAPEQVQPGEDPISPATDLYALGVMLYQMLSGDLPFDIAPDAHPYAVLLAPVTERRVPLCERRPDLPTALGAFVDGTLALHPADRPASAAEFLAGYRRALGMTTSDAIVDPEDPHEEVPPSMDLGASLTTDADSGGTFSTTLSRASGESISSTGKAPVESNDHRRILGIVGSIFLVTLVGAFFLATRDDLTTHDRAPTLGTKSASKRVTTRRLSPPKVIPLAPKGIVLVPAKAPPSGKNVVVRPASSDAAKRPKTPTKRHATKRPKTPT
ncbi:MAG: serine/threonine protein kinase, partial [Deltaproteobacteria bacterium]|nr:serine/threonine protein kinase [Deltaproteobacteria bacterium]